MKRKSVVEELIAMLDSISISSQTIESFSDKPIISIIDGMKKEKILRESGEKSILEIVVKGETYICELDEKNNLARVFQIL